MEILENNISNELNIKNENNLEIKQNNFLETNIGKIVNTALNVGIRFINEAFSYLKKEVPDYKNNKYFENRSFFKRTIEKNMLLTKIYVKLYK